MAAEAVFKIKEAEEKGSEMIKEANEKAKEIIEKAKIHGEQKKKSMIDEAIRTKEEIIDGVLKNAMKDCDPLVLQGEKEISHFLNPDDSKFKKAVETAIERIVNVNGNS